MEANTVFKDDLSLEYTESNDTMAFHITYMASKDSYVATSVREYGITALQALQIFYNAYPNAIFVSMVSQELIDRKLK